MSDDRLKLVIGNKGYSSWSMRPWLLMKHFGIPFDEQVIPLRQDDTSAQILRASPSGKVPALIAKNYTVWDSLAIIEFLAEKFPHLALWPKDETARAYARAISAEMHSSFQALRAQCPMNFFRARTPRNFTSETLADIARITDVWSQTRHRFGGAGPFLFGEFCAADAMYAPVVQRFEVFCAPVSHDARTYMENVMATAAWRAWADGAGQEVWRIARFHPED